MKKIITVLLVLGLIGLVSSNAADAKENFEKNCAKCHGPDGAGQTKMGEKLKVKDYTKADAQAALKDDAMTKAIKEGVKDGEAVKMKAFPDFSDDEVKALVAYFRTFKK